MPKQLNHGKDKKYCDTHEIDCINGAITNRGVTDRQLAAYFQENYALQEIGKFHDSVGRTALHMAASCGRVELCEWLIFVAGANINAKDLESGYTPLQRAIFHGHIRTAVRLMQIGADLTSVDREGLNVVNVIAKDRLRKAAILSCYPTQVSTWGSNDNYTLGTGTNNTRKVPELLDNFKIRNVDIKQVCIDEFHSVFLSRCCRLWCCGNPQGGRLGIDSKNHCLTPTLVFEGRQDLSQVAISVNHTLVLLEQSQVLACGQNDHYQLGISPYLKETATFKPVFDFKQTAMPKSKFTGVSPYLNKTATFNPVVDFKQTAMPKSKFTGICAGKYHSVFYNETSVYVCGLNGGQFGLLSSEPNNIPYVKVPTEIPIHLKAGSKITSLSSSNTCIVFSVSSGGIYTLYQNSFKNIAPKQLDIKQVATCGGSLSRSCSVTENSGPLKVAVLTTSGYILIWEESLPQLKRCYFGLNRSISVSFIFLNERQILFTSRDGEAFSGTIGQIKKYNGNISNETKKSGFQKFLIQNESYHVETKRIPNVYHAVSITSDPKGKNFAVRQVDFTYPMITCGNKFKFEEEPVKKDHYRELLEEASEFDTLHDVIFMVENTLFPAHKYIVANANSTLLDLPVKDGRYIIIKNVLPVIFKEILLFIYTGSSDLLKIGPVSTIFSTCSKDPLKLLHDASSRYKLDSLSEKVLHFKYQDGQVMLNVRKVKQLPEFNAPKFDRESHPEFYDIALKSSDEKNILAHKCILATRLEYFHHMLTGGWTESSTSKTLSIECPWNTLKALLDYLYKDEAPFTVPTESYENIARLLIISDQLLCETLRSMCEVALLQYINLKNAASQLEMSSLYNAPQLKKYAMKIMSLNMDSVIENRVLEMVDCDILFELDEYYKEFNKYTYMRRIIAPYVECTISEEEILSSPDIHWPPELTESNEETPEKKNKDLKERIQKPVMVTLKKKPATSKKTNVTEIIAEEKHKYISTVAVKEFKTIADSSSDYETVLNASDFPELDYQHSPPAVYNYKPRSTYSSEVRKVFPPRLSQKERKRRSMELEEKSGMLETEQSPKPQFKGWTVIPPLENVNKDEEINLSTSPPMVTSFVEVIASEQKERDNFFKMKSKPFALTQLEDKAIEELSQFYNASNVFDERITVQRVLPINIAKPIWIKSHKKNSH